MADVAGTVTATSSNAAQVPPKAASETVAKVEAAAPAAKAPEAKAPELELTKADAGKTPEPAPSTPPAEIVYDLKVGENSALDPKADVEAVIALAKEQKWAPEVAKKVLEQREAAVKSFVDARLERDRGIMAQWPEQLKNDKEIGGDKLVESLEYSKRLLEKYGDDEIRKGLADSNLGNYPAFVRLTAKIGRVLFAQDKIVTSNQAVAAGDSVENLMFPMAELHAGGGQG